MNSRVLSSGLVVLFLVFGPPISGHSQTTAAGKVDVSFAPPASFGLRLDGAVKAIAVLTNGQVLAGGDFSQPYNLWGLARFNTDGTADSAFTNDVQLHNAFGSPGNRGRISRILPRPDGRYYIHGEFSYVDYKPGYTNLAVLDSLGHHDPSFIPTGLGPSLANAVLAVAPDSTLLVCLNSNQVHRLNEAGGIQATYLLAGFSSITDLAVQSDGRLCAAGRATETPPFGVHVARFSADGVPDSGFASVAFTEPSGNGVYSLAIPVTQPDDRLVVLGSFSAVDGQTRGGLVRLNADGTIDSGFVPGTGGIGTLYQGGLIGLNYVSRAPDGRLLIARQGPFRYSNTYRGGIARLTATGALDSTFDPGAGPAAPEFGLSSTDGWGVRAVAAGPNGEVYVGGTFTNFNKTGFKFLVRLNAGTASATPTITAAPASQSVTNGVDVTFTVTATGPGPFTYTWRRNGAVIAGAASATLTLTAVDLGDVGAYIVTVANSAGSATAAPAILTVNGVSVPDFTGPGFKVTSPAGTSVESTIADYTFSGTASDNQGLASLVYQQGDAAWQTVALASNWSFGVTLAPGTNVFRLSAGDTSGNYAATQRVVVFFHVPQPLSLAVNGDGVVTGATNGQSYPVGRNLALKATAATGSVFSNWVANGTVVTNSAFAFPMGTNSTVVANFVANPFASRQGTYSGLFYETNDPGHATSGSFSLKLTSAGTFSAKLLLAGIPYTSSGTFDLALRTRRTIVRKAPLGPLTLELQLASDSDGITGTVSDGTWTSDLSGHRATFGATSPATAFAGAYTMLLSGSPDPASGPEGQGHATIVAATTGALQFKGALGDATVLAAKSTVATNGECAVYLPLYKNAGSIFGWLTLASTTTNDIHGRLLWTKPSGVPGALYSGGFTGTVDSLGSAYVAPAAGARAVEVTDGILRLSGGNLAAPSTNDFTLSTANLITFTATNLPKLTLKLTPTTGLIAGSFVHPVTLKPSLIKGVVLQKQEAGGGSFAGTNEVGAIFLGRPGDFPLFR